MSTSGPPAAERKLTLRSSDGEEFELPEAVAVQSHVIKGMIEADGANNLIHLVNVTGTILAKVMEYCSKHADAASEDNLRNWDAEFLDVDQATLFGLMMAADYLQIDSLLELTVRSVGDMMKGKTIDEIRKSFDVMDDNDNTQRRWRRNCGEIIIGFLNCQCLPAGWIFNRRSRLMTFLFGRTELAN